MNDPCVSAFSTPAAEVINRWGTIIAERTTFRGMRYRDQFHRTGADYRYGWLGDLLRVAGGGCLDRLPGCWDRRRFARFIRWTGGWNRLNSWLCSPGQPGAGEQDDRHDQPGWEQFS